MSIGIHVPSFRRAGLATTPAYLPSAVLWVHSDEAEQYAATYPDSAIEVLPDATRGNIAAVRNHILDRRVDRDEVTAMVDDDLDHVAYWEGRERIKVRTEDELLEIVERYSVLAGEWGSPYWGVNVHKGEQNYRQYTPFSTVNYASASFSVFLRGFPFRYDERFSLKEDYDLCLQVLNAARIVLRVNKFHYVKRSRDLPGGCAAYRSMAEERRQFALLQRKWGGRIVQADKSRSGRSGQNNVRAVAFDINPVIRVPIEGV